MRIINHYSGCMNACLLFKSYNSNITHRARVMSINTLDKWKWMSKGCGEMTGDNSVMEETAGTIPM